VEARGLGLVVGDSDRFRPDSPLSRAEMAVMLQRFLTLPETEGSRTAFSDMPPAWSWAAPAVGVLNENGILMGFPEGSFGPSHPATRVRVAAMLERLYRRTYPTRVSFGTSSHPRSSAHHFRMGSR